MSLSGALNSKFIVQWNNQSNIAGATSALTVPPPGAIVVSICLKDVASAFL